MGFGVVLLFLIRFSLSKEPNKFRFIFLVVAMGWHAYFLYCQVDVNVTMALALLEG
jgi:hypothetical protein